MYAHDLHNHPQPSEREGDATEFKANYSKGYDDKHIFVDLYWAFSWKQVKVSEEQFQDENEGRNHEHNEACREMSR